ncbi:S26 family signal peptidase [Bacillus yapensis]|uniref:S26 family signal peptidase n=1 Tax=Bacillus yapensis TaxID=2492960 RepID=UPI001485803E|nr:S26 family signal peptidase [Bacillus yapensis]
MGVVLIRNFSVLIIILFLCGCSGSTSKLTDTETSAEIQFVEKIGADTITIEYTLDNMDRGERDYYEQPVVIEQNIETNNLTRGSVVWFEDVSGEQKISRVIGLPNEAINIKDGQIFIDGQQLDAFYGKAHRAGLAKQEYLDAMKDAKSTYDEKAANATFEKELKEQKLGDKEYFLVSDDWFRGEMSVVMEQQITGIVLGYEK